MIPIYFRNERKLNSIDNDYAYSYEGLITWAMFIIHKFAA